MAHRQEKLPRSSKTEADFTGDLLFPNHCKNGKEKSLARAAAAAVTAESLAEVGCEIPVSERDRIAGHVCANPFP